MSPAAPPRLGRVELTALLASSMALAALGIDLLLPAFADIRADLGLPADSTAVAGLVTTYFLGLAAGQLVFGPLSDRFGRKPLMQVGFAVYAVGALLSAVAPSLPLLLAARFVWGVGGAGPRSITVAIVRDRYEGDQMSRAMSLIMAVFILVPVLAPTVGALGVQLASWRWLFVACTVVAAGVSLWLTRMVESLAPEDRRDLRPGRLLDAARTVATTRASVGGALAMTLLYGGFTSYLASSEIIFGDVYGAEAAFPVLFGALAAVMGLAMWVNARIVERVGARRVASASMGVYVAASAVLLVLGLLGALPLAAFMALMGVVLACHAFAIPNLNAIAMQPVGSVAGMASALIGTVQVAAGAGLGAVLDQLFDGTTVPLSAGFLGFGVLAVAVARWADAPAGARRADRRGADRLVTREPAEVVGPVG